MEDEKGIRIALSPVQIAAVLIDRSVSEGETISNRIERINISELDNYIGIWFGQDYDLFEPGDEIEPKIQAYIGEAHKGNLYALLADIELFLAECDDIEFDLRSRYKGEFVPANWDTTAEAFLALTHERVSAALSSHEH